MLAEVITDGMPLPDAAALRALEHWQLEPIVSVDRSRSGVMNEVFIVTTTQRTVVLRKHRRTDLDQVSFEHTVIRHAIDHQIPTPAAISSRTGEPVVDHQGTYYSLFSYADGDQVDDDHLSAAHAHSMGSMLARLHDALAAFPVGPTIAPTGAIDPVAIRATIASLIERIDQLPQPTEQDAWAREHLQTKARWLTSRTLPPWRPVAADLIQLVHGDYLHTNLFFAGTQVSAVIDWDKAEPRWPIDEIIRAFDLSLQMRPELCAAMIDGYRSIRPLPLADLDRSANNWSLSMLSSQWLFEGIYFGNNDRLRTHLEPGPFVPFSDHWDRLRTHLG